MTHTILNITLALLCLLLAIALVAPPILTLTKSNTKPEDVSLVCLALALALLGMVGLALVCLAPLAPT